MEEILRKFYENITEKQIEKLNKFKELLIYYNNRFNLTAIKSDYEITVKHFADSIVGGELFKENASVIEIGSGGGFPSIPLKIIRNDLSFTLVESVGKKCKFLEICKKELNFDNFTVINARCEDLAKKQEFREKYDYSVARAVARLNTLTEYCLPFVKVGGEFIAYKTSDQTELKEAENAIKILGGKIKNIKEYSLENVMDKRCIYSIEKISLSPEKYPRGNGKERTKPIL